MDLCVSCKGCKRECPTGVDMAAMKVEFLYHYHQKHGLSVRDRLFAYLPRYAHKLRRLGFLLNLRDKIPGIATLSEWLLGLSRERRLPHWRRDHFLPHDEDIMVSEGEREVVLLVDTFNSCFDVENANAAREVLNAAGYRVICPQPVKKGRPLCCGRTFLSSGLLGEAKLEANRMLDALMPYTERGVPIVGLEPSCLLTLRDEYKVLMPGDDTDELAKNVFLLEEFLATEHATGRLQLDLKPIVSKKALLHGHCHQKAFNVMSAVQKVLSLIPELEVKTIDSSCCGMAGSFGYEKEHYDISMKMGSLSLFPAVKEADTDVLIVADGTSCRSQIEHGTGKQAMHVARVLQMALNS